MKQTNNLTHLEFNARPKKLRSITFHDTSITEFEIPSTVESMSNYVFHQCNELKTLTLPPLEAINAGLLDGSYVENLILPEGIKVIGQRAFASNNRLKSVSLPETLERRGAEAVLRSTPTEFTASSITPSSAASSSLGGMSC